MRQPTEKELKATATLQLEDSDSVSHAAPDSACGDDGDRKGAPRNAPPSSLTERPNNVTDPKPGAFDNLSKRLDQFTDHLAGPEAEQERRLRAEVLNGLRGWKSDRTSLGRLLVNYRPFFKSQGQWTEVVGEIAKGIRVSSRTLYRVIDDYERSATKPKKQEGIDLTSIRGEPLSRQEQRERDARLALRTALEDIPKGEKLTVLERLLSEEAYQVWGERQTLKLDINPVESRFTIDGRKRLPAASIAGIPS